MFTVPCLHGKYPRRISTGYKSLCGSKLQASFNLRPVVFFGWSLQLSNFWVSTKLTNIFFFLSHSLWGEEWDKLWAMSQQRDGECWQKTFCFLHVVFILDEKKKGGGTTASSSSSSTSTSTSTPVRLVWGVTDPSYPPSSIFNSLDSVSSICPEYLRIQCLLK